MIEITMINRAYSVSEFKSVLRRYFFKDIDVDYFYEYLIESKQIEVKAGQVILPAPEIVSKYKPKTFLFETISWGRDRLVIRFGDEWIRRYKGIPNHVDFITDHIKTRVLTRKGRDFPAERMVAELPADLIRDFKLKPGMKINVVIDILYIFKTKTISFILWGYRYSVWIGFGETKAGKNARYLEINGMHFINEVSHSITIDMNFTFERVKDIIIKLLEQDGDEYFSLYKECVDGGMDNEAFKADPLPDEISEIATVQFRDIQNGRMLVEWRTITEHNSIPQPADFYPIRRISAGKAMRRGQTRLMDRWRR